MMDRPLDHQARRLAEALQRARPAERAQIRSEIERIIASLGQREGAVRARPKVLRHRPSFDGDEDFFDNMPV
jgi:ABC-type Zn2+ transport system substrate-binding protein/surface adhesin